MICVHRLELNTVNIKRVCHHIHIWVDRIDCFITIFYFCGRVNYNSMFITLCKCFLFLLVNNKYYNQLTHCDHTLLTFKIFTKLMSGWRS